MAFAALCAGCGGYPERAWKRERPDVLALVQECSLATGIDLAAKIGDIEFVDGPFPCRLRKNDPDICYGTAKPRPFGWVVKVAMVNVHDGQPTILLRDTSLIHEVAGHVAYGWIDHQTPPIAGEVVGRLYGYPTGE